jgi:hypothetical protein
MNMTTEIGMRTDRRGLRGTRHAITRDAAAAAVAFDVLPQHHGRRRTGAAER